LTNFQSLERIPPVQRFVLFEADLIVLLNPQARVSFSVEIEAIIAF
jgi:hypothetical protein